MLPPDIKEGLRKFLDKKCKEYSSGKLLPLMTPTFGVDEILEALDSMAELNVTMGSKVENFEKEFSRILGTNYSTMLNSGSSANLLALSILSNPVLKNPIKKADEIIVPAVTWSTSIFPIMNIGAKPVLVDVDQDYLIDIEKVKESITNKTKAIMPVHLLGNVCDMKAINDLSQDHNLFIVEDCCEALGSEFNGRKVGTFSDFSSFSFYFSHHITTIEGGMLCTSEFSYADLSRILRAHGYVRHSLNKEGYISENPGIDPRFLFVNTGFNFRPTDLQGAFGIHQIGKLESYLTRRAEVGRRLVEALKSFEDYLILPREKPGTRHSWFAFPITVKKNEYFSRLDLVSYLEENGIETRPLVCGNFAEQPAMKLFDCAKGDLSNSSYIMRNSFYIGIHPNINDDAIGKVIEVFFDFFAGKIR